MRFARVAATVAAPIAIAIALIPSLASAHPGAHFHVDMADGFAHPLGGLDHLLAMLGVGLLAWRLGGRAIWAVPTAFVALMAVGGLVGFAGFELPFFETGIALSLVAFGAAIALRQKLPTAAAAALVGFFAMFHGFAHGAELPAAAGAAGYAAGFLAASAMLHVAGIGLAAFAASLRPTAVRFGGAAMAVAGVALLIGV
jgi:urease accessory protein